MTEKKDSFDPFEGAEPLSTFLDPEKAKKYKFEDFNPKTVSDLLPGWKSNPRKIGHDKYPSWEFTRTLENGDEARFVVNVSAKEVYLFLSTDKDEVPTLLLKDVRSFKLKPRLKELAFEGRGIVYTIKNSIWHYLSFKDRKTMASIITR